VYRTKILTDMAQGLLRRIYLQNSILQSAQNERPTFLADPELTKIRSKIEKAFPELPDLSKVGVTRVCCVVVVVHVIDLRLCTVGRESRDTSSQGANYLGGSVGV
jgi:hypothetical protein